ncbi:MAG: hypothetical protein D6772_00300 [Bacteroidetes bacterium]|nr:MAG: hypothetical protein D6772_00300 [Bacteroidota bacterium]
MLSGQTFDDALRYSFIEPFGTARFVGAGGALGPLGADYSVINTNPAGLAWMRRSEFMFTPALVLNTTESTLVNGSGNLPFSDAEAGFKLPNVGYVVATRGVNFALGLNRIADFNQQFFFQGSSQGSIVNRWEELANAFGVAEGTEAGLANEAFALIDNNGVFITDLSGYENLLIRKEQLVQRSGSLNEFSIAFAGNSEDKILWGVALGIPFLNYQEEKAYQEEKDFNTKPTELLDSPFNDLRYNQDLTATGSGINLKLGIIYRMNQMVRFGASIHTPTYYQIAETFGTEIVYRYTDVDGTLQSSPPNTSSLGDFNYKLRSPWRFNGGVGAVFGKSGFLSGEVEYVNYSSNRFIFDGFSQDEAIVNDEVEDNLTSALKLRVGGEYAQGALRLRAGLGTQQAPLANDDTWYNTLSAGVGLRQDRYFVDFAYRRTGLQTTYSPFVTTNVPQQFVDNNVVGEVFLLTVGFKW